MSIIYADEIGVKMVEVDEEYGVSFCDGKAYFTDVEDVDYTIPVESIREFIMEKTENYNPFERM